MSSTVVYLTILGLVIESIALTNFADTKCGQRSVRINAQNSRTGRIAGGSNAIRGEYPWIVSLQYSRGPAGNAHFCGGFLISNRDVITAAHCLKDISKHRIQVIIGEYVIGAEEVPLNAFSVAVERIVKHPEFNLKDATKHDIAILQLKTAIEWNTFVQPACLPSPGDSLRLGEQASVAGWGITTEKNPEFSKTLMTVNVPILSTRQCEKDFEWTGTGSQFCAGAPHEGLGACNGDSGSPIMAWEKFNESLSVVGIHVAGGKQCGVGMHSGIYTRMASYVNWIKHNLKR